MLFWINGRRLFPDRGMSPAARCMKPGCSPAMALSMMINAASFAAARQNAICAPIPGPSSTSKGPGIIQRFGHHRGNHPPDRRSTPADRWPAPAAAKVRRMQLVIILAAARSTYPEYRASRHLAAVIHNQQRHVSLLLYQRRQLAEFRLSPPSPTSPTTLRCGLAICGADRHRRPIR